jgi:hypothetical protein
MKRIPLVVIALFSLAIASCGDADSSHPRTPGEHLLAAMHLIRTGEPEELRSFVVEADQPGVAMFFGVYSSGWQSQGGLDRVEVVSEEIEGENATVLARFHLGDGSEEEVTYRLRRVDDDWKLILP